MERFSATFLQDYLKMIKQTIAAGQQSGAFRKTINAGTATKIFFGALDEMATNWVLSQRKYDLAAEADAVVDIFIDGAAKR
jgi:TetR/AcrR family transcriptional regulator, fatty acid metabolism regulator protein